MEIVCNSISGTNCGMKKLQHRIKIDKWAFNNDHRELIKKA
jgi:hypothetical protein